MRRFLGSLIVIAALTVGPSGAASAAPPPGVRCGDTVSGTVTLTRSLSCRGVAFHVHAPDELILDLAGFTLTGPGRDSGIPAIAYTGDAYEDTLTLTIHNGAVRGWGKMIDAFWATVTTTAVKVVDVDHFTDGDSLRLTIQSSRYRNAGNVAGYGGSVTVIDSVLDSTWITGGVSFGADVIRSTIKNVPGTALSASEGGIDVTDSVIVNTGTAIAAYWSGVNVTRSVLKNNEVGVFTDRGGSISAGWTDTFVDSSFVGNGTALSLSIDATVTGNTFTRNDRAVYSDTADRFLVQQIELYSNVLTRNGDAIYVDGPSVLKNNRAVANRGIGIYAPDATDLGGNIAYRNGVSPQCTGVVCTTSRS